VCGENDRLSRCGNILDCENLTAFLIDLVMFFTREICWLPDRGLGRNLFSNLGLMPRSLLRDLVKVTGC